MKKRPVTMLFTIVFVLLSAAVLHAKSLSEFLATLPADSNAGYVAATKKDLTLYQTKPKHQEPTGGCPTFSMVAALEAAYTRKYCPDPNSWLRQHGMCDRYEAIRAVNPGASYFFAHPMAYSEQRALDVSEIYFIHRVLTMITASTTSTHESGNSFDHMEGIVPGATGDIDFIVENLKLPPETAVPWIYDYDFWATQAYNAVHLGGSITQENIDSVEFTERKFTFDNQYGDPITRAWVPLEGRRQARYGATDMLVVRADQIGDKVKFLEKAIYTNHEVVVDGAYCGHSMLLVGYDRSTGKFLYKDHYEDFAWVNYSDTAACAGLFAIVFDVSDPSLGPSGEEMWMGTWNMDLDGRMGKLVIRRTRIPPNALYTTASLTGISLQPASTDKWARVGSFYEGDGSKHTVYGKITPYGGTIMELSVDFDTLEGPPDSISTIAAGYSPPGQQFVMRIYPEGDGAAVYATGYTLWNGNRYGVLLQRPGRNPYGVIPHHPATTFSRSKWIGKYRLRLSDGQLATLTLAEGANADQMSGTILWPGQSAPVGFTALFKNDNDIIFGSFGGPYGQIRLYYNTWEDGVVVGSSKKGVFGTPKPFYGVALPTVILKASDPTATESLTLAGAGRGVFTLTRSGEKNIDLTVKYAIITGAGYAANGVDYAAIPLRVVIPAGSSSATIVISPRHDHLVEGTEKATLRLLSDPAYLVGRPYAATVLITDSIN